MNGKAPTIIGCFLLFLMVLGCSRPDGGSDRETKSSRVVSAPGNGMQGIPGILAERGEVNVNEGTGGKEFPQARDFGSFLQLYGPFLDKAERDGTLDSLAREIELKGTGTEREIMRLLTLRKRGDEHYPGEARKYLRDHEDAALSADLLRLYAKSQSESDFREVGQTMAKGDPHELLHCSEIARNEDWDAMKTAFAKDALAAPGGTYAIKYRSVKFLEEAGDFETVANALPELERMAEKRYQKEDLTLLRCSLAVRNGTAGEAERNQLHELAENGMVPPTRKQAAELLAKLETNAKDRP